MDSKDIEKNIPYTVNINSIDLGPSIINKREFLQFKSNPFETFPENGYFNHQNLIIRYFNTYDRLLNINEAGTGKSSVIAGVCEYFKNKYNNNLTNIRKWFILVPSDTIKREIINDVLKRGNYKLESKADNKAKSITQLLQQNNYVFYTYEKFLNDIKNKSEDEIKEKFSNVLFFIDEAHRLLEKLRENKNEFSLYTLLWKIFHLSENMKIQLTSATPMINDVYDIIPLINLLNPANEQLNFNNGKMYPYKRGFEYFIKNKFSYVKTKKIIQVEDMGQHFKIDKFKKVKINRSQKCYYDLMIEDTDEVLTEEPVPLKEIYEKLEKETLIIKPGIYDKINFRIITRKNSYLVINRSIQPRKGKIIKQMTEEGKEIEVVGIADDNLEPFDEVFYVESEFKTYQIEMSDHQYKLYSKMKDVSFSVPQDQASVAVNHKSESSTHISILNTNDSYDYLSQFKDKERLDKLHRISPKFHFILENELKNHYTVNSTGNKVRGKSYIYYEYIVERKQFLDIFKLFGFEECNSLQRQKGLRYCILDANEQKQAKYKLEIFNSYENRFGEYIQIIIFGKAFAEGMNLDSMMRCYITNPQWNYSKLYQIIARGIRATSHNNIINDMKPINTKEQLKIKVYKLACVYKNKITSDLTKYATIEKKKMNIDIVFQYLKESSFDKVLNRFKNNNFMLFELEDIIDDTTLKCKTLNNCTFNLDLNKPIYIEQLGKDFIAKVKSITNKSNSYKINIELGNTVFSTENTVIIVYNMDVHFDNYMIKNNTPYYSDSIINESSNTYLKEYSSITDSANYKFFYSNDEIVKYKNSIAQIINKEGFFRVTDFMNTTNDKQYIIYKAINRLLQDKKL